MQTFKNNEKEILLPPGVKSIKDLNSIKIEYDYKLKQKNNGNNLNNNLNNNNTNVNSTLYHDISNSQIKEIEKGLTQPINIDNIKQQHLQQQSAILINSNNNNNNSDDYFEDMSIIDEEKPKNVKPYVKRRNRKDVLRIISKKIVPNKQLLEQCEKTSTTTNEDEDKNTKHNEISNKEVKLIPQNQLKYLNENGTMIPSQKIDIKNIIKNTHNANVNKKSTSYIYDHKGNLKFFFF